MKAADQPTPRCRDSPGRSQGVQWDQRVLNCGRETQGGQSQKRCDNGEAGVARRDALLARKMEMGPRAKDAGGISKLEETRTQFLPWSLGKEHGPADA